MRHVLGQLRRYLLGIAPAETTFARRGFAPCAEPVQARIERVGAAFLRGYHSAMYDDRPEVLSTELDRIDPDMRGFAYEGAAMVLALLNRFSPWRKSRVQTFLAGAGGAHAYMVHVGVGWAFARVGRRIERWLDRRDPLLRWLVVDGYGFHEGYFHCPRAIDDQVCPRRLVGYARRAFDQGLGRSLWFVCGADADRVRDTIGDFAPERRADLWSGIGLASAYAGGVLEDYEFDRLAFRVAGTTHRSADPAHWLALDAAGPSLTGLLKVVGAAYVLGAPVRAKTLFDDRLTRLIDLERLPRFLANPCELAPAADDATVVDCEVDRVHSEPIASVGPSTVVQGDSPLDVIRRLVAERSELPISAVHDDHRLLSDLHLNSITVGQVVVDAARALGLPAPIAPTEYANATLNEVAQALMEGAELAGSATPVDRAAVPAGVDAWVRTFTTEWVERSRRERVSANGSPGSWRVIAAGGCALTESINERFGEAEGDGIVVCLPAAFDESHVDVLLRGARMLAEERADRFVLAQPGAAAAAFARTLHLERPDVATCVVDVPEDCDDAAEWVLAEACSAQGYTECRYDSAGRRFEPVLRVVPDGVDSDTLPLDETDVLLVTGGGKGIAAECALDLARRTGVRLALLGRSEPQGDRELTDNLERLAAAVLHAAGINVPQRLETLDRAACLRTLAPKVDGVRNVLAAIDPGELKLLVSFGSIIARVGLAGEADYALANAWLARLTEQWQQAHPHCRCLAVEWSIWSGVGMGQRLGRVDALLREGITPITPEVGVETLRRLIAAPPSDVTVVATGRFGRPPTVRLEEPALPMARFLERPRVHYPGIELVADAVVSAETDSYLNDHVLQSQRVLPAVIALEAMAQIASALSGAARPLAFENVAFDRPIVVPEGEPITVRVAGLVRDADHIDLVVRCETTGFQVDHFRATCSLAPTADERVSVAATIKVGSTDAAPIDLVPERDLYGDLLFHTGRFRCLRAYRHLTAIECVAEIDVAEPSGWFGAYLPGALLLGDPAARDATIHAVQACIPHARVLPTGVERILLFAD